MRYVLVVGVAIALAVATWVTMSTPYVLASGLVAIVGALLLTFFGPPSRLASAIGVLAAGAIAWNLLETARVSGFAFLFFGVASAFLSVLLVGLFLRPSKPPESLARLHRSQPAP